MQKYIFLVLILLLSCRKERLETEQITIDPDISISDMLFVDQNLGFAVGGIYFEDYALLQTEDGGRSWQRLYPSTFTTAKYLYTIKFEHGILYIGGQDGKIIHSTDTGKTWHEYLNQTWADMYDLAYLTPQKGVVASSRFADGIMSVVNYYGESISNTRFTTPMSALHTYDTDHLVAGGSGIILYSTDGADNWYASDADGDVYIDFIQKDEKLYAIGHHGTILQSSDRGHSWTKVKTIKNGGRSYLRRGLLLQDGRQIIVGDQGRAYVSSDNWKDYTTYQLADHDCNLLGAYQTSSGDLLLMGTGGRILYNIKI